MDILWHRHGEDAWRVMAIGLWKMKVPEVPEGEEEGYGMGEQGCGLLFFFRRKGRFRMGPLCLFTYVSLHGVVVLAGLNVSRVQSDTSRKRQVTGVGERWVGIRYFRRVLTRCNLFT